MNIWRKGNYDTLLVGMQISTTIMENGMEDPQQTKSNLLYEPTIPLLGIYRMEMLSVFERYLHYHVYHSTCHNSQDLEST